MSQQVGRLAIWILIAVGWQAVRAQEKKPVIEPETKPSAIKFNKVVINENSDFECSVGADVNRDGKMDIVCGDTWYEAPKWTPHKFRDITVWGRDANNSGYRGDFADLPIDVNGDGATDIVSCDYATGELYWHENPGKGEGSWTKHPIAKCGSMETTIIAPLMGKDRLCILPNTGNRVMFYELKRKGKEFEWVEHVVGKEGGGHGVGFGDVNNDGKLDITTPFGWWESLDPAESKWSWHPDWVCKPGDMSVGTPVMDFDGDGKNEVVFGSGHNYGVYLLKQGADGKWAQTTIDSTWSQAHTLILATLAGRTPVILTGKRLKAHDHDPGAEDPLGVYYYNFNRKSKQWEKFVIDKGTKTGVGLQVTAVDLRKTGRLDIITAGKSGLYLFENVGR